MKINLEWVSSGSYLIGIFFLTLFSKIHYLPTKRGTLPICITSESVQRYNLIRRRVTPITHTRHILNTTTASRDMGSLPTQELITTHKCETNAF